MDQREQMFCAPLVAVLVDLAITDAGHHRPGNHLVQGYESVIEVSFEVSVLAVLCVPSIIGGWKLVICAFGWLMRQEVTKEDPQEPLRLTS